MQLERFGESRLTPFAIAKDDPGTGFWVDGFVSREITSLQLAAVSSGVDRVTTARLTARSRVLAQAGD
jgi:hypothetical protein